MKNTDVLGRQPVHLVAQAGSLKSLEFLAKKYGISLDTTTSTGGLSPMHLAAKVCYTEICYFYPRDFLFYAYRYMK